MYPNGPSMEKKKNERVQEFPSIYRRIPESLIFKKLKKTKFWLVCQSKIKNQALFLSAALVFFVVIFLTLLITIFSIRIYRYYGYVKQIKDERQSIKEQINFWQNIVNKYDGYKDGYFQIALLQYRLANFQKAKEENKKALLLDPNFEDARKLEVLLERK